MIGVILALILAAGLIATDRHHRNSRKDDRARLNTLRQRAEAAESRELALSHALGKYRCGLTEAVDAQFKAWALSPAESEVGWLLLKGLSLHEIAATRASGERTVRHQAQEVYQKAGLAGRAELAAYFIEDWLAPENR